LKTGINIGTTGVEGKAALPGEGVDPLADKGGVFW
jgi:hypothetical protein